MSNTSDVKPKTAFGQEVAIFTAKTGLKIKELAKLTGVKYGTMIDCTTGRTPGHEVVPKVREYMNWYLEHHEIT